MSDRRWYVRYTSITGNAMRAVVHYDRAPIVGKGGVEFVAEIPERHWDKPLADYALFFDRPKPRVQVPHA